MKSDQDWTSCAREPLPEIINHLLRGGGGGEKEGGMSTTASVHVLAKSKPSRLSTRCEAENIRTGQVVLRISAKGGLKGTAEMVLIVTKSGSSWISSVFSESFQ